jgi:hypothetical protein
MSRNTIIVLLCHRHKFYILFTNISTDYAQFYYAEYLVQETYNNMYFYSH